VTRAWLVALTLLAGTGSAIAQVPNWPSERVPRPLAARDVKFPPYSVRTLANGLQVIAVSHHEQPAVSIRLIVRAGAAQDPADRPGAATLASALLDQGTTTRTAEQIASAIDSVGGAIGAGSGTDLTFVTAVVMKDSFDLALDMVSDVVRNPAFAPEEIERQRQQILSGLKVSYEDPDYLAGVVFDRLVYGFHPYGKPGSGTPESVAALTRDDLLAFHKRWFGANNAILAIVGDITADEAFAGAERAFGKWGKSEVVADKAADVPPATRRLVVVDRPGAVQTEIRVGHVGLPRKHPDYLALDLAIKILGGEGGNRLHRVLRSERGLTYGASADINALKDAGDIVAETDTRSDTTAEALRLIVDEIWRLQRQRVSARELGDAQAYLTGSFPLTIETPSAIALQILNAVFYGLDLNELQTFRERVNAISPDDIQRVARQYLHPDRLSIVLVGDASVFAKQLAGVGFEQFERIPLNELDLNSVDFRRKGASRPRGGIVPASYQTPATASSNDKSKDDVRTLVARAVEAKGGLDKLRSIKTMRAVANAIYQEGGGGDTARPTLKTITTIRYPGMFRVDAHSGTETMTQVFNAGEYWIRDVRGVTVGQPYVAEEFRASVQRDALALLIALSEGRITARREKDDDGMPALWVEGGAMRPVTLVIDPNSALIVKQRYTAAGGARVEERFSDYRAIDGIQVAHRASVLRDSVPVLDRRLEKIEFNIDVPPGLFTKPS
jgi:zinc protease